MKKLHRELKLAIECEVSLFWSPPTKSFVALPMNLHNKFPYLQLIKSFE